MKKTLQFMFYILFACNGFSQTATNFISNDCSGLSHNLFSELDEGKVIVICWVMPCGSCINPASTAYNVVNSFQTNYPNKVYYYLADDYADDICSDLSDWATNFNIPESSFSRRFSNAVINMNDYDTPGMPKVVVIAGAGHNVFFNQNVTINPHVLTSSIDEAIIASGVNSLNNTEEAFHIYSNPANEFISFSLSPNINNNTIIELYNSFGQKVFDNNSDIIEKENNTLKINSGKIDEGIYYLRVKNPKLSSTRKVLVVH